MSNITFNGPFKDVIPPYIKYKQSQGYKYEAGIGELKRIDNYFKDNNCKNVEMTEDLVINYCKRRRPLESNNTIYKRQYAIKNFAMFLKEQGYNNIYVYNYEYIKDNSTFEPYIFSDDEIKSIFNYIDNNDIAAIFNLRDYNFNQNFRIIIRLCYCCGLRKSEVLHLKMDDINFDNGTITIRESKNYCTRILPVSDTVLKDLRKHIKLTNISSNGYLFKNSIGNKYNSHFTDYFKKILRKLEITTSDGKSPRLHDLRFTYAVKALEKMQDEGQDIYCTLPILSLYLGHKNVKSTEHYLKYTKTVRNKIIDKTEIFNNNLFLSKGGSLSE